MEYNGKTIEELAKENPIIHSAMIMFYRGDIETYQDALELMVFVLNEHNEKLSGNLMTKYQTAPIIIDKEAAERLKNLL